MPYPTSEIPPQPPPQTCFSRVPFPTHLELSLTLGLANAAPTSILSPAQLSHPGSSLCPLGLPTTQSYLQEWNSGKTQASVQWLPTPTPMIPDHGPGEESQLSPQLLSGASSLRLGQVWGPLSHTYRPKQVTSWIHPSRTPSQWELSPQQEGRMGPGAREAARCLAPSPALQPAEPVLDVSFSSVG